MLAIYKKECRAYFMSVIGFVFLAFFLAVTGIYTVVLNMVSAYSNFEYVLDSISFIFILLAPILTMRIMAEEKRQKTDQLLYTSPISVEKIVMGKYLSVLTLFGIATAVCMTFPLILSRYGTVDFVKAYEGILGFFLLGAAYLAMGMFVSSLTESQVVAAVLSFLFFLFMYWMPGISSLLPSDHLSGFLILCGLGIFAALILYSIIRSIRIAVLAAVLSAGGLTAAYIFKPEMYDGILSKLCEALSVAGRFENFTAGILDAASVIYYLSIIGLSLFFTVVWIKSSFTAQRLKSGAYQSILTAVVICITIMINLVAGQAGITIDLSSDSMYTLTPDTTKLAGKLEDDVTIYYIAAQGKEISQVENILMQYKGISSRLKVKKKDPVLYPTFTSAYTEEGASDNSVIVVNETTGISKYISLDQMLISEMDYQSYQMDTTAVDVEGQVTAAIQYVTAKDLPVLYQVRGHGEVELGTSIVSGIEKLNMSIKSLETISIEAIPKDCDILLINAPTVDISKEETEIVKVYLEEGGSAVLTTGYTEKPLENYSSLLGSYGLQVEDGIVFEEEGNYISGYPSYLLAEPGDHEIVAELDTYVVAAISLGMRADQEVRSSVSIEPFLTTSGKAYSKVNLESDTIEKEPEDISGPFILGAAVTESFDGKETKLAVFSTPYFIEETFLSKGQFDNEKVFLNSLSWMSSGVENNLSIPSRSVAQTYLSVLPSTIVVWGVIMVLVIPVGLLITGVIIWLRRRKA